MSEPKEYKAEILYRSNASGKNVEMIRDLISRFVFSPKDSLKVTVVDCQSRDCLAIAKQAIRQTLGEFNLCGHSDAPRSKWPKHILNCEKALAEIEKMQRET